MDMPSLGVFAVQSLYLLIPSYLANMAPVLFRKMRFLEYPVDFGKKWRGKPVFGAHKTFRGFFFGILLAIIVAYVQKVLYLNFHIVTHMSLIDYSETSFLLLGLLLGFGALFGDLVESFFKRRIKVKPGKPWIPFDQVDWVVGSLLFLAVIYIPPWQVIVFLLVVLSVFHILIKHLGFYLEIGKERW